MIRPPVVGPVSVVDADDPRLAGYAALSDRVRRDRLERQRGEFTVEGLLALEQLFASDHQVVSVLVAGDRWDRVAPLVAGCPAPCYVAPRQVLRAAAGFDVHRGVLALGRRPPPADPVEVLARAGTAPVVVCEGVNDHENLGAIFRNAAALGAGAVLADPTTCDPLYRRSIRVSIGHSLRVPWARLEPWPAAMAIVRASGRSTGTGSGPRTGQAPGRSVWALTPDPAADDLVVAAGAERSPVALLVGAEGAGLSASALACADRRVRIGQVAGVDSLNVATVVALALHRLAAPAPGHP